MKIDIFLRTACTAVVSCMLVMGGSTATYATTTDDCEGMDSPAVSEVCSMSVEGELGSVDAMFAKACEEAEPKLDADPANSYTCTITKGDKKGYTITVPIVNRKNYKENCAKHTCKTLCDIGNCDWKKPEDKKDADKVS